MSAHLELTGSAALDLYDAISNAPGAAALDDIARAMWGAFGEGRICEADATALQESIDSRRTPRADHETGRPAKLLAARMVSRFKPRQRPRCPDRQASRDRRRRLGGSSALPDTLRAFYTEGQRAVLCIVAGEIKHHGACDLPIDKIAALAGVCRTTVQTTLHEARRLGHIRITARPQPGRKNLPNLVEISSPEWKAWLRRGPSAHQPTGSNFVKKASPTKNTDILRDEFQHLGRSPQARMRSPTLPRDLASRARKKA